MAELGLNATHEEQIVGFLDFSRGKRAQCLKDVESAFSELAESRLLDDTFTSDEVKEMLDGLCAVLKADVGSDLINNSHTSALLLRQLFQQAEQWHLKLKVDLSEIQSGELLAKIADFEQRELSSGGMGAFHKRRQLDPINTTGGEKLLQMEIDRVKEDNCKLQSRIQELEETAVGALSARDRLKEDLLLQQNSPTLIPEVDVSHLHQQISDLQLQLTEAKSSSKQSSTSTSEPALRKELETTSHKLLKVSAELEEAKKDLQRKFNETTQYNNMRKMMESKTATIQALRSQLKQLDEKET